MLDTAERVSIDVSSEAKDLRNWLQQHDQYVCTAENGSLWAQGYDKLKLVQRNIFNNPIDSSKLY